VELIDILQNRRMTRQFSSKGIDDELIKNMAALALSSPTAGNCQGVDILILNEKQSVEHFWEISTTDGWHNNQKIASIKKAPVIIIPLYSIKKYTDRYSKEDKKDSGLYKLGSDQWGVPFWLTDVSFMTMTILLLAENYGLGALFFQLHRSQEEILRSFMIPDDMQTIGAIAIGRRSDPDAVHNYRNVTDADRIYVSKAKNQRIHINHW